MQPAIGPRLLRLTAVLGLALVLSGCGVSGERRAADTTAPASTSTTDPSTTTSSPSTTSTPSTTTTTRGSAPTVPGLQRWTLVKDKPSGLSFRLPKKPMLLSPQVTAPDGAKVTVRGYQALVDKNLLVQVSVYDLAGRSFDADKAIDGVAASAKGTVVSRTHTPSGGLDIVDAKIRIPKGPALGYDRVFKVGDHAVQLWTLGLANDEARIRLVQQRLSSSFRLG